jgi:hypothetical protein
LIFLISKRGGTRRSVPLRNSIKLLRHPQEFGGNLLKLSSIYFDLAGICCITSSSKKKLTQIDSLMLRGK